MSGQTDFFLIDSNVLVYAYDITDERKHILATTLLNKCWKRECKYAISVQNLAEFFVIVTTKIKNHLSVDQAQQIVEDICAFSGWLVLHYNSTTFLKAVELYKKNKKHFWDALIAATMRDAGIGKIYSENADDFKLFEGIVVIDPFV